jgi:hypothetical protein
MYKLLIAIFFIISTVTCRAQTPDSLDQKAKQKLQARRDSAALNPIVPKLKPRQYHPDSNHSPHKAVMHSLLIPGWGQVYNHQWWKVPIIYAGLAGLADTYIYYRKNYSENLAIAKYYENGTQPKFGDTYYDTYQLYKRYNFSPQAVNDAVAAYSRYRDLSTFAFIAFWGIQVIDSYVTAKFQHSYTMDNDLSMKVSPTFLNPPMYAGNFNAPYIPGLKLTFTLR